MKIRFNFLLIFILGLIGFSSCTMYSDKPEMDAVKTDYNLTAKFSNPKSTDIMCATEQKDTINLEFSSPLKSDITISYKSDYENFNDYLIVSPEKLTIKSGEKSGFFEIKAKPNVKNINKETPIYITFTYEIDGKLKTNYLKFNLLPFENNFMTLKDYNMIQGYKKNLGIDIMPLIGKWKCWGQISTYYTEDADIDEPNPTTEFSDEYTIVTLSPLATKDRPILAMIKNAFGLNKFYEKMYRDFTVDNDFFYHKEEPTLVPASWFIMNTINFTPESKETYNVSYYTMEIDPKSKQIKKPYLMKIFDILELPGVDELNLPDMGFVTEDTYIYTRLFYFPLVYDFSPWNRAIQYQKDHPSTYTPDDDTSFATAVVTGSFSPYQIFYNSSADIDGWENERDGQPTNFIEPIFTIDINKKEIYMQVSTDGQTYCGGYNWYKINMKKVEDK